MQPSEKPTTEVVEEEQVCVGDGAEAVHLDETLEKMERELPSTREAKDIGLPLHVSEDRWWPQGNFTTTYLLRGSDSGKYKYTFTSKNISDDEVTSMIRDESEVWKEVGKQQAEDYSGK